MPVSWSSLSDARFQVSGHPFLTISFKILDQVYYRGWLTQPPRHVPLRGSFLSHVSRTLRAQLELNCSGNACPRPSILFVYCSLHSLRLAEVAKVRQCSLPYSSLEHFKNYPDLPTPTINHPTILSPLFLNSKPFQLSQHVRGKATDHHVVSCYDCRGESDLFCIW